MARIPVYQSQVGIRSANPSSISVPTTTTDQQMLLSGLNSIADAALKIERQQQAVKGTQYATDFVNSQTALQAQLNDAQKASKTGIDYIPASQQIIKSSEEQFFSDHPDLSEKEKQDYRLRWAQSRGQLTNEAINWGQGQAKAISVANLEDSAAAVGNVILQNPAQARALADAHLQAIDQSDLDPATKAQLASRSRNAWALAAAQYGINNNPQHVIDQQSAFRQVQASGAGDGASLPSGSAGNLAVRNNNPLNIRFGNNAWAGKGADNGTGFENFDTPDHGFRAGLKLIKNHISNGDNTLSSLIKTWAPASDNNNPAQYAQAVSKETGIPVDAPLNPNDQQQITSVARAMAKQEGYTSSVTDNQLNRAWHSINDPSMLAPGVPWGQLTPQQTQTVINQAQAKVDQRNAQTRLLIQQQMQDDTAMVEQGIPVSNPISRESWMATAPADATPQQIELLGRQYERYQMQMGLQGVYSDINTKSSADGLAAVQAIKPVGGEEDFSARQQMYQQAQQKYQQVISAREKDPGGWLAQNSPDVKAAYQLYAQDPSQGAALAQSIIVEKNRLGIKSKDVLPDVLTDSILQQIDNSKEQSVANIQAIGAQFGQYSQQVMEQVQKKAGPVLQVVMATANPRAANALWQNRNVKTTDLRESIDKPSADNSDTSWTEQAKDFAGTIMLQPGGNAVWNNFNEQGKRLTYINVQRGMSPSDAAKQAYQDVIGEQYQTSSTWRMPNKYGIDLRDVSDGTSKYLDSLTADKIMPLIGDPRLSDEVNRQQSLTRIKDKGQWVTNSDETGLTLMLNGLLVNGSDGQPITVSFGDLAKLGSENRSSWNSAIKFVQTPVTFTPGQSRNYTAESQRDNLINVFQGGQRTGR